MASPISVSQAYHRLLSGKARYLGRKSTSRRDLLRLALGLGIVAGGWQVWIRRPRALEFSEIPGLPGWRQLSFRGVSSLTGGATGAVFLGMGAETRPEPLSPPELCDVLYPNHQKSLPVAYFTDVNCPNCRSLEIKLATRADKLKPTTLHLPLLGSDSLLAAKAIIAAELQGRGREFRAAIWEIGFAPQLLGRLSTASGVDFDRLGADIESPEIEFRLELAKQAAETLGIYGTPALTIGRTLVIGDIPGKMLDRLIALEAERSPVSC